MLSARPGSPPSASLFSGERKPEQMMKVGDGDTAAIGDARCTLALSGRCCCPARNNVFLASP